MFFAMTECAERESVALLAGGAAGVLRGVDLQTAQTVARELEKAQWRGKTSGAFCRQFPQAGGGTLAVLFAFFDSPPPPPSPLLAAAQTAARALHWRTAGGGKVPALAAAELIGPGGMLESDCCRAGLFFQPAGFFYSWHRHAAEEIHFPVCGKAQWLAAGKKPQTIAPMTAAAHHLPRQPHATRTTTEALLTVWAWTGDTAMETYEMCAAPEVAFCDG